MESARFHFEVRASARRARPAVSRLDDLTGLTWVVEAAGEPWTLVGTNANGFRIELAGWTTVSDETVVKLIASIPRDRLAPWTATHPDAGKHVTQELADFVRAFPEVAGGFAALAEVMGAKSSVASMDVPDDSYVH